MQVETDVPQTLNIWKNEITEPEAGYSSGQIDKRECLSREEFLHEYVLKNRPVVLKNAARSWKALGKWTPEFFRERYGERMVPVFERKRALTPKGMVRLKDYIDEITSSNFENRAKYLFALKIPKEFPELLEDLEPRPAHWDPNWLDSKYLLPGFPNFKLRNITGLEMNMGGTGSPFPFLHYDDLLTQTFITQVYGRKLWIMFEPNQSPYMYPSEDADNISRIPMDQDVDLSQFPLFVRAKAIKVVVEEGEMLYGAPGWWHTTQALTPSIAVVLSTANGPLWPQVTKSAFHRLLHHPKWYVRPTAFPVVAYMTAFRAVKSITDPW
jgi:hypothetical protein